MNFGFKRKILAVEVVGDILRGAVMVAGGGGFDVQDLVTLRRPVPDDDLPDIDMIRELGIRLGMESGHAVFVTSMARAVELPMGRKQVAEMRGHALKEAVTWEVEPYTGITGANALVGLCIDVQPPTPGMVIPDEEDDEVVVNVSVLERNVYRAIKERFKAAGFSLKRIYPPDVCFYMPLYLEPEPTLPKTPRPGSGEEAAAGQDAPGPFSGTAPRKVRKQNGWPRLKTVARFLPWTRRSEDVPPSRAILEVGRDYSSFGVVEGGVVLQVSTLNISHEAIGDYLANTEGYETETEFGQALSFTLRQAPGPLSLVVSGVGAEDPEVVAFLDGMAPHGAKPLVIRRSTELRGRTEAQFNSAFSTVVGAGIRELSSGRKRAIGIDDSEPVVLKLRRSAYMMPLVVMLLLFAVLFAHYEYMHLREMHLKREITRYTRELKDRKTKKAKYDTILKRSRLLEREVDFLKKRIDFGRSDADRRVEGILDVLEGIAEKAPSDVVLTRLEQTGDTGMLLSGTSWTLGGVGNYATALQEDPWCKVAEMMGVQHSGDRFHFEMELVLQEGE